MPLSVITTNSDNFACYNAGYNRFLNAIAEVDSPAFHNMGHAAPSGFAYLVKNKVRWTATTGEIALLRDNNLDEIVGISAVEHCPLSDQLTSGGNRCFLRSNYRSHNEVTDFLLSSNLEWTRRQNKPGMLLTFNHYNKWIYEAIVKKTQRRAVGVGTVWSDWWNDCIPLATQILLHNTLQWAVIKPAGTTDAKVLNSIAVSLTDQAVN
jgi:hypothetical protein